LPGKQLPKNFVVSFDLTKTSPQRVGHRLPGVHGGLDSLSPTNFNSIANPFTAFESETATQSLYIVTASMKAATDSPLAPENLLLQSAKFPLVVASVRSQTALKSSRGFLT
jgi:hypothetical protein